MFSPLVSWLLAKLQFWLLLAVPVHLMVPGVPEVLVHPEVLAALAPLEIPELPGSRPIEDQLEA